MIYLKIAESLLQKFLAIIVIISVSKEHVYFFVLGFNLRKYLLGRILYNKPVILFQFPIVYKMFYVCDLGDTDSTVLSDYDQFFVK